MGSWLECDAPIIKSSTLKDLDADQTLRSPAHPDNADPNAPATYHQAH